MSGPDVMFPEEQQQMTLVCARLARDANAKAVLLIGRDGQPIADAGDVEELDVTSLSSLTAGNVAATGGISKILREKDFSSLFDERSSLGLVRLRVRKSSDEMVRLFDQVAKKAASKSQPSILTEITDSDIDNLFND
jgi:hypothetical protein